MKRTNYEKLAADTAAAWKSTVNADHDPVTEGQRRAADLFGQLAAFMEKEMDAVDNEDNLMLPFEIMAAITSNEVFHMCYRTDDPRKAAAGFAAIMMRYLTAMIDGRESGKWGDGEPGVKFGQAIDIEKIEVPN